MQFIIFKKKFNLGLETFSLKGKINAYRLDIGYRLGYNYDFRFSKDSPPIRIDYPYQTATRVIAFGFVIYIIIKSLIA